MSINSSKGNDDDNDEWTFVSSSSKTKKNKTFSNSNRNKKGFKEQMAKAQHAGKLQTALAENIEVENDTSPKALKSLSDAVERCMNDILYSKHVKSSKKSALTFDFMSTLDMLKMEICERNNHLDENELDGDELDEERRRRKEGRMIDEIICYGVGNFAIGRKANFSAPFLQISYALLLRKYLAIEMKKESYKDDDSKSRSGTHDDDDDDDDDTANDNAGNTECDFNEEVLTYEQQQKYVPMYYFEPDIKPIESKVLQDIFHIHVLEENEQGKRCVKRDDDESNNAIKQANTQHYLPSTLFYMPYCPMTLYTNVLWANWDPELLFHGRLIIIGNSFIRYNEGIGGKWNDNGISSIIPFVKEKRLFVSESKKNEEKECILFRNQRNYRLYSSSSIQYDPTHSELSWEEVSKSFDLTIISFSNRKNGTRDVDDDVSENNFPSRPEEFIPRTGTTTGELK